MKTDELLRLATAPKDLAGDRTGMRASALEKEADEACAKATAMLAPKNGEEVDTLAELVHRVKHGLPVPGRCGGIAWAVLFRQMGKVKAGVCNARLRDAASILFPHLIIDATDDPISAAKSETQEDALAIPASVVLADMTQALSGFRSDAERRTMRWLMDKLPGPRTLPSWNGRLAGAVAMNELRIVGRDRKRCEKLIRVWSNRFRLDPVPSAVRAGQTIAIETVPIRIEAFLRNREHGAPLMESGRRAGQACLQSISEETGLAYASLRNHRHLIDAAVASGRATLIAHKNKDSVETARIRELRGRRLAFVEKCVEQNVALPTSPSHRRAYDFKAIAAMDSGVVGDSLENDIVYTASVYRLAPIMAPDEAVALPGTTYGQFECELRRERKAELSDRKTCSSMVAQTMRAYADFRNFTKRDMAGAIIGDELSAANVERVIDAVAAAGFVRDLSNFQTNIRIVARLHHRVAADDGLGDDPRKAISLALRRSKKSLRLISEETGIPETTLTSALYKGSYRSAKLMAGLPALETSLNLAAGTLIKAVGGGPFLCSLAVGKRKIPRAMQDFVASDWATMRDEDFEEMIAWIDDNLIKQPTPFGRAMSMAGKLGRAARRIRLELGHKRQYGVDVPTDSKKPFQRTLETLVAHKMDAFAPDGLRRRGGAFWMDHTARMRIAMMIDLANLMTDPIESGGLGIDPDQFDLAHLLNPNLVKVYVDQVAHRLAEADWGERDGKKRGPLFTRLHADLMILLASIFREHWGFAYQQPQLALALDEADLRPLPPLRFLVSTAEVQKVLPGYVPSPARAMPITPGHLVGLDETGYQRACVDASEVYATLGADLLKRCRRSRDPIATIKGIVHSDEPVKLVLEHLKLAEGRMPSIVADPMGHHLHVRNLVVFIIGLLITFRPRNMRELTDRGDETQIWFENGLWRIEIPHDRFKNWASTPLFEDKSPFQRTVPEIPGLYRLMDYYVTKSRPFLVGIHDTPNFFVDASGAMFTPLSYWRQTREFSARHLAFNPYLERGIRDVMPFNPYAWRYIRATDILLHPMPGSNPVREAANALQTSEAMINRYYGRIRPNARNSNQDERFVVIMNSVWS